ncbi:polyketide transferase af380 [Colletotrichum spaethianum]|uniref:Polyketide transferase af380 n=1 Tax=Colletotrichum spaethianum TaxID=700344 RepID=A0AA37LH75_9PEZI|nr:polyketide transferase af380 [Colletotrichum spaethianum]GKT45910.1 polyketide transferase af380 [Colletotrichum spaethianum]
MASSRDVEFKTYDGIKLRGTLFPAGENTPCIIMNSGASVLFLSINFLPDFAVRFQAAGITALIYDNRCLGDSEGSPRDEVDPLLQTRDYFDAFCYATTLPEVDANKIVYWGSSMSGGTALVAAALNKNIAAVVVQVPFISGEWISQRSDSPPDALFQERASAISSGAPSKIPSFPESLEHIKTRTSKAVIQDPAAVTLTDEITRRGQNWGKWATVQSLLNCSMFEPLAYVHRIAPTPLLMVVAEKDVTTPSHLQLEAFNRAREPKKLQLFKGQNHFSMYYGQDFEMNVASQIAFLKETLKI